MKWFLVLNVLIIGFGLIGDEVQKAIDAPTAKKKAQISKIDKEFHQKLSDLKTKQLQKIINFTPGFKIALQSFFAYDWKKALEKQNQKSMQDEVLKKTKRLQDDYAQLVVQELIDGLAQMGSYFSIQTLNENNKKEFIETINDAKNAQDALYKNVISYQDQAKKIVSPLLAFADLSPAPYRLWYQTHQSVRKYNAILATFVEVVQPLIEANNTMYLENNLTKAKQTYSFLQSHWKAYEQKVTMLLKNLLTMAEQEQELKPLLNRIFSARARVEESLSKVIDYFRAVVMYGTFIPSLEFVDRWLKIIDDTKKFISQWNKKAKEWQNEFNKRVERHQSVYEYLDERKVISDIQKSFSLEIEVMKEDNAFLAKAQQSLTVQKSALQTKKSSDQTSGYVSSI